SRRCAGCARTERRGCRGRRSLSLLLALVLARRRGALARRSLVLPGRGRGLVLAAGGRRLGALLALGALFALALRGLLLGRDDLGLRRLALARRGFRRRLLLDLREADDGDDRVRIVRGRHSGRERQFAYVDRLAEVQVRDVDVDVVRQRADRAAHLE